MIEQFEITREIGIDAAHRVPLHGSKCRNLHGHRYTIQATCTGPLIEAGEQSGMVLDFGFLKELMMQEIDEPCDHGTIVWQDDRVLLHMLGLAYYAEPSKPFGAALSEPNGWKVYVVPFPPTAEELARHWFERLAPKVAERSSDLAKLARLRVWETPNCFADYFAPEAN
jgi:6-pyruvoyltetrahydropterin/6-carboxytetrahydropterin synthase